MYVRLIKTTFSKLQVCGISRTTNQSQFSFSCAVIGLVLPLRLAKSHDFVMSLMGCLPFYKEIPEILVGNLQSVRTVLVIYHLPKISGLSRHARQDWILVTT